jgi:hypothetical protein
MEPAWTQGVQNWFICDWFYAMFMLNIIFFTLGVILFIVLGFNSKKVFDKGFFTGRGIAQVLIGIFACTTSLFYYLMCERALKPTR